MTAIPPCAAGITAILDDGTPVYFAGASRSDAEICWQEWRGRDHPYLLGFWGDGSVKHPSFGERSALRRLLTSPVGGEETFRLPRRNALSLWKSATVEHVANADIVVAGMPRPAIEIKVVLHDALGRPEVRAEYLYWIDVRTGIPLQKETVTRLADGTVWRTTNWRVVQLSGALPGAVEAAGQQAAEPGSS